MKSSELPKICTSLWFDDQAEQAANFYVSLFPNSKITAVTHYGDENPERKDTVLTVDFVLNGTPYNGLNGGPVFAHSEAASIMVNCDSQAEIDRLWEALTEEGQEVQCGWLKDKFGLSWQISSSLLMDYLLNGEPEKRQRAVQAMYKMTKLDNEVLKAAYEGA